MTEYTIGTRQNVPFSVMGVASVTKSVSPTEDTAFAKDTVALFQTGSVFLAGKITDKIGVFAQAIYNNYDNQNLDSGKWQGKWSSDNIVMKLVAHDLTPENMASVAASQRTSKPCRHNAENLVSISWPVLRHRDA